MHDASPDSATGPSAGDAPDPARRDEGLARLGQLIAQSRRADPGLLAEASRLTRQAGGHRLPPGVFCAALLDLVDRIGRVPPATWLSLCRGIALGASLPGQQGLPLPLRQAAQRLIAGLDLPEGRRLALSQALMIDSD